MGRSEEATASIGIKILLSDLVEQLNETNMTLIREMLYNGRIEDNNGFYNETYMRIIYYDDYNLPENHLALKKCHLQLYPQRRVLVQLDKPTPKASVAHLKLLSTSLYSQRRPPNSPTK